MSPSDTLTPMSEPFVVELPAAIRPLLEAEAREHGFATVADYIAALVRANAPVAEEHPQLETALVDGLSSGESRHADESRQETQQKVLPHSARSARRVTHVTEPLNLELGQTPAFGTWQPDKLARLRHRSRAAHLHE